MGEAAGSIFFFEWEMQLMEWLQSHIGSSGAGFWILSNLSAFGEELLMVAIMGFLYWGLNKEFGKYVGLNVLVVNVWNPIIKNLVLRLRPYFVPGYNIKALRPVDGSKDVMDVAAQGYSFPSGHSSNAVTVYGSLAAHEKKRGWLWAIAVVLPLLVGFSRVFVGVHYPTDVLCGFVLGALVVFLIPLLRKAVKNRWLFYGILLLTSLPGFFFCKTNDYFTSFGMMLGFMAAEPFEERFVNFKNTNNINRCVLRTAVGGLIYFGLNTLLKLPFPSAILDAGNFLAHLIRTLRYAVVLFTVIGVYPMLFKYTDKLWNRIFKRKKNDNASREETAAGEGNSVLSNSGNSRS
jgi:undecaprenyl-diphosphatase